MTQEHGYRSPDPKAQENQTVYHELLGSIERTMDPNSNTVLVVDDSRLVRKAVTKSIAARDKHVVVIEAEDGLDGLEKLAHIREQYNRDPVFILTDLEMPVMDGWAFIEALRKDYTSRGLAQGIPIIVLSSSRGEKGFLLSKKSVHGSKAHYEPIVTVAKEDCLKPDKYDGKGDRGLSSWLTHMLRKAQ